MTSPGGGVRTANERHAMDPHRIVVSLLQGATTAPPGYGGTG